ncbi:succinate dehydrogenase/fumarate reductase flavoprotein [Ilyonectria destructans]|nr:succinate dehydrogenase/fumarate reductase flavoprotein [Ilyonectria destructans]
MVEPGFSGFKLWLVLFESAKKLGHFAALYTSRADSIWQIQARPKVLYAPSVVLAAGGFAFNWEMRREHLPKFSEVAPLGTRGDDGSVIVMGQAAGGSVTKLDRMSAWRFLYPSTALLEGVVMSKSGERMISEDSYGATLSDVMIRQHQGTGFLILDSVQWAKAKKQASEQTQSPLLLQRLHWLYWSHKKASTLDKLATKFDISPSGLQHIVDAYNGVIATGQGDPVHKAPEYYTPVLKPPFYSIDISPRLGGLKSANGLTLGGLRVDGQTGLVLTEGLEKIPGLYAAGRTPAGICANGYVSGLSIAGGVFSGERAGFHLEAS